MKISELFVKLKGDSIAKKIADPIRNAVSAYQKVMDDDEVLTIFFSWKDVLNKLVDYFDNNPFTLRNYVTAYRDLAKMDFVIEAYNAAASMTMDAETVKETWLKLTGEIERARAQYVKAANETSRIRRRERDANLAEEADGDDAEMPEQDVRYPDSQEMSELTTRISELEQLVDTLRAEVQRVEQKWMQAMKCVLVASNTP